jgi:uncharacterized membrane protein YhaH (DUF805 family)
MMFGWAHPLVLLIVLAMFVAALVLCWRSRRDTATKVIWTVLIIVIPVLGSLVFLIVEAVSAPARNRAGGRA